LGVTNNTKMTKKIYSSYKIFGGFGVLILINFMIGVITYVLASKMGLGIFKLSTWIEDENILVPIFIFSFQLLLLRLFINENRFIIIDNNQLVLYNPLFPILKKVIRLDNLDYCMTINEYSEYDSYEAIYFVKNDNIIGRLSSFYYSNYSTLKHEIQTFTKIKDNQKVSFVKQIGIQLLGLIVKR
jgi:hypothetical protein